jgi:osmotically-inducible protein OsmY
MPQDQRGWRRSSRDDWEDERDYGRGRESARGESRSYRSQYEDDQSGYGNDRRQDRDYEGTLRAGDYGRYEEEDRGYSERLRSGGRGYRGQYGGDDFGGEYDRGGYGGSEYGRGGSSGGGYGGGRPRSPGRPGGTYGYGESSSGYSNYGQSGYGHYGQSGRYEGGGGFGTYTRDYERNYGSNVPSTGRSSRGYEGGGQRDHGNRGYGNRGYGNRERDWWDRATDEVSSWFGDEDAQRRRQMDHHRGRGPKNYTRSDDRIRDDVSDQLTDDPLIDASDIEVSANGQEVTLSGTVASRNERRLAEEVAEQVSGVKYVQNNLRVKVPIRQSGVSGTSGTFGSGSSTTSM